MRMEERKTNDNVGGFIAVVVVVVVVRVWRFGSLAVWMRKFKHDIVEVIQLGIALDCFTSKIANCPWVSI